MKIAKAQQPDVVEVCIRSEADSEENLFQFRLGDASPPLGSYLDKHVGVKVRLKLKLNLQGSGYQQ
jgi:hypothetical protein